MVFRTFDTQPLTCVVKFIDAETRAGSMENRNNHVTECRDVGNLMTLYNISENDHIQIVLQNFYSQITGQILDFGETAYFEEVMHILP